MSIAALVPTRDRRDRVLALVKLLLEQGAEQVVVVDDGSSDGTAAALTTLADDRLTVVRRERSGGPAAARAAGIDEVRHPIVLLLDDDVVPDAGLVQGHRRAHDMGSAAVLGAMPLAPEVLRRPANRLYDRSYRDFLARAAADPDWGLRNLWGGHLSLPTDPAVEALRWNASFPARYHEDRDLGLALARQRLPLRVDRSLVARHMHDRTLPGFYRDEVESERGLVALAQRWPAQCSAPSRDALFPHARPALRRAITRVLDAGGVPVARALLRFAASCAPRPTAERLTNLYGAVGRYTVHEPVARGAS